MIDLKNIFGKKKNSFKTKLNEFLKERFKVSYLVLGNISKRNLTILKGLILNELDVKLNEEIKFQHLISMNKGNFDFLENFNFDNEFIKKSFKFEVIDDSYESLIKFFFNERIKWFDFKEDEFKNLYIKYILEKNNLKKKDYEKNKNIQKKINEGYEGDKFLFPLIKELVSFELYTTSHSAHLISILDENNKNTIYVKGDKNLKILKEISLKTPKKGQYKIVELPHVLYNYFFDQIQIFDKLNIKQLRYVTNNVLRSYFISIMNNSDFSDLMLYGKETEEGITFFNNFSVKYKGEYRYIDGVEGITDVDDLLDNLEDLGFTSNGLATSSSLTIGDFSFRAQMLLKDGYFGLSLRKNEGYLLSIKEIEERSGLENLDKYVIDTSVIDNENKNIEALKLSKNLFLNPNKVFEHYQVNFDLPYEEIDNKKIFNTISESKNGLLFINAPTGHWKTTALQLFMKDYIDQNVKRGNNKNIITIENPLEGTDEHIHQFLIKDDDGGSDYKVGVMSLKRMNPDLALVGELRDGSYLKYLIDIGDTAMGLTTLHTSDIENFLRKIKDYSTQSNLDYRSGLSMIAMTVCQYKTYYDSGEREKQYDEEGKEIIDMNLYENSETIKQYFLERNSLIKKELLDEEKELKKIIEEFISLIKTSKSLIPKEYIDRKQKLTYEIATKDQIISWYNKYNGDQYEKVYENVGFENTRFYKLLNMLVSGKIILRDFDFGEYSIKTKSLILKSFNEDFKKSISKKLN